MSKSLLDCVLIGYNDIDLKTVLANCETTRHISAGYRWMMGNVVKFRSKWLNYMDLMNAVVSESSGVNPHLHAMQMPNLGVCYLQSFLARRDFSVEAINFFNSDKDRLASLLEMDPRAVAITTTFYVDNPPIAEIVQFVRRYNKDTKIIVGGPHIWNVCSQKDSLTVDYLLRDIGADIYIYDSQGEDTLARVLSELRRPRHQQDLMSVPNLVYQADRRVTTKEHLFLGPARESSSFVRTGRQPEANSMDENAVDWSYIPRDLYVPTVQIRTARSCAFACSFCRYPVVAGDLSLTSLEIVERELKQLHNAGVENLVFIDDTFNVPLPRFKKLLQMMIRNKFEFNWFSYFRCSNSDDEAFNLMKASGCKGVFLGIESGDQGILNNMNKFAQVQKYKDGIRKLNDRDIMTYVSLVIGFPGETQQSVQNTIDLIEETEPTFYKAEVYFHDEDVPIHTDAEKYGLTKSAYSWAHKTMNWEEASDCVEMMHRSIKGSVVFPPYMFDFWSIPYLIGKGIKRENIQAFARAAQPLLLKNYANYDLDASGAATTGYGALIDVGRMISHDLQLERPRSEPRPEPVPLGVSKTPDLQTK